MGIPRLIEDVHGKGWQTKIGGWWKGGGEDTNFRYFADVINERPCIVSWKNITHTRDLTETKLHFFTAWSKQGTPRLNAKSAIQFEPQQLCYFEPQKFNLVYVIVIKELGLCCCITHFAFICIRFLHEKEAALNELCCRHYSVGVF